MQYKNDCMNTYNQVINFWKEKKEETIAEQKENLGKILMNPGSPTKKGRMFPLDEEESPEQMKKAQTELETRLKKNNNLHALNTLFVQKLEFQSQNVQVTDDLRFPKNEADFNLLKALGQDRGIKSITF